MDHVQDWERQENEQKALQSLHFNHFSCLLEIGCHGSVVGMGLFCPVTHRKVRKTQGKRSGEAQLPHGRRDSGHRVPPSPSLHAGRALPELCCPEGTCKGPTDHQLILQDIKWDELSLLGIDSSDMSTA